MEVPKHAPKKKQAAVLRTRLCGAVSAKLRRSFGQVADRIRRCATRLFSAVREAARRGSRESREEWL